MKTYNQTEVDEIIYKVKNIKNAFLEGIDSNLKSIQNIKETFVTGAEKQIEKLQNLQPADTEEPEQKSEWRQKPSNGEKFFHIGIDGTVKEAEWVDYGLPGDVCAELYESGNCFPSSLFTEEQVQQITWQNQLNSLLTMYAVANNALASKEERENESIKLWWVVNEEDPMYNYCRHPPLTMFSNEDIAKHAYHDVVEPFLAEHPEFVW